MMDTLPVYIENSRAGNFMGLEALSLSADTCESFESVPR